MKPSELRLTRDRSGFKSGAADRLGMDRPDDGRAPEDVRCSRPWPSRVYGVDALLDEEWKIEEPPAAQAA